MQRLRFYVSAQNLLSIHSKNFTGVDPENPNYGYPIPLNITFGINVTFGKDGRTALFPTGREQDSQAPGTGFPSLGNRIPGYWEHGTDSCPAVHKKLKTEPERRQSFRQQ